MGKWQKPVHLVALSQKQVHFETKLTHATSGAFGHENHTKRLILATAVVNTRPPECSQLWYNL